MRKKALDICSGLSPVRKAKLRPETSPCSAEIVTAAALAIPRGASDRPPHARRYRLRLLQRLAASGGVVDLLDAAQQCELLAPRRRGAARPRPPSRDRRHPCRKHLLLPTSGAFLFEIGKKDADFSRFEVN